MSRYSLSLGQPRMALGSLRGAISMALYVLVGVLGLPGLDRTFVRAVASASVGTAAILAIGVTWLAVVNELSPSEAVMQGVLPVAVAGVVKVLIAAVINTATWSALSRMELRDAKRTEADD